MRNALLLIFAALCSVCSNLGASTNSDDNALNVSGNEPVSFDSPPRIGQLLQPQLRLIHCGQEQAARFSSNTGFIGGGCQKLTARDTWSVIRCELVQLPEGDMWLVIIQNKQQEQRFVPIPWHDWA